MEPTVWRNLIGHFATGVGIITVRTAHSDLAGCTVNSITSISTHPPLLLCSLQNDSDTLHAIQETSTFAVHILSQTQKDLADLFASDRLDKFAHISYHFSTQGTPLLDGCVAYMEGRVAQILPAADHQLILAEIQQGAVNPEEAPLMFYQSRYWQPRRRRFTQVRALKAVRL
ncbi:MAG: flavin reductase family protein [Firmicutes bacterium]|nr:flavin reductase family protein [Bacillota bacterium]